MINLFLSIIPGLVWLFYYLKKDLHPEPKRIIFAAFLGGIFAGIIAAGIEALLWLFLSETQLLFYPLFWLLYIFVGIGFTEETLKFLIIKNRFFFLKNGFFRKSEFDEPTDVIIYLISAGLGFATLENILIIASQNLILPEAILLSCLRFISATFLHALCSASLGFFVALSFFKTQRKKSLQRIGLLFASTAHGLYDLAVFDFHGPSQILVPAILLISLATFVSFGFKKLKKIASVCKIEKWLLNY